MPSLSTMRWGSNAKNTTLEFWSPVAIINVQQRESSHISARKSTSFLFLTLEEIAAYTASGPITVGFRERRAIQTYLPGSLQRIFESIVNSSATTATTATTS